MSLLRFITPSGSLDLIVDPTTCERSIHARSHWRQGSDGTAICACTPEPPARDDWAFAYQVQP